MSKKFATEDRRIRRTRAALCAAMEGLLAEKPFRSVTVADVAERADVNRATFYLHYADTGELILDMAVGYLGDLAASFGPVEEDNMRLDRPLEQLVKVFRHVKSHAALYRACLEGGAISPFDERIVKVFRDLGLRRIDDITRVPGASGGANERDLVLSGSVGAILGVIAWWLRTGMRRSPEYVAERAGWLVVGGSYPLLGLRPPSVG